MTLITRVSAFFLLALAICLIGYSAAMYGLIRRHIYREFDHQLEHALNVLVAAVEVESDEVKWQPSDHAITLGDEREEEEVRWVICDQHGHIVDTSPNLKSPNSSDRELLKIAAAAQPFKDFRSRDVGIWRTRQQRLVCLDPKPKSERDIDEFAELILTVGRDAERLHSELWKLRILAIILPVGLWTAAAIPGRAYCRRALRPLGFMAERARSMTNADFNLRLPVVSPPDELSSLGNAFNNLLDRLQQAYQQQQRFTGDAAHQLRTPLTILRGEIDVALRRPRGEAEYQKILHLLSEQTDELQETVETLLFLARSEGEENLIEQQVISLQVWLPDYLTHWQNDPRYKDISLEVTTECLLKTNPALLRQALDNLISNALKYSPPGSPVRVSAVANHDSVIISVEDHGSGIPETEREMIFEPFFRSAKARQQGVAGTGLGLAIVARIATVLDGSVRHQPVDPTGSQFVMAFPMMSGNA